MSRNLVFVVSVSSAAFLAFVVFWFFISRKKRRIKKQLKQKNIFEQETTSKEQAENIVKTISKSKELYKTLIAKVHPDRIPEEKKETANALSQKITLARYNYTELVAIEKKVNEFLNQNP